MKTTKTTPPRRRRSTPASPSTRTATGSASTARSTCAEARGREGLDGRRDYIDNTFRRQRRSTAPSTTACSPTSRPARVDAVLVVDQDRLARRPAELETLHRAVPTAPASRSPTSPATSTCRRSDGRLQGAASSGAVARQEGEKKGERMIRKFEQDARRGVPASGPRPFGYPTTASRSTRTRPTLIREMAARMLDGETAATVARDSQRARHPGPEVEERVDGGHGREDRPFPACRRAARLQGRGRR